MKRWQRFLLILALLWVLAGAGVGWVALIVWVGHNYGFAAGAVTVFGPITVLMASALSDD